MEVDKDADSRAPSPHGEKIAGFIFGIIFVTALLIINLAIPEPSPTQYQTFKIILALAAAGVGGILAGFLQVEGNIKQLSIRAGGALALFVIVFFFNPAMPEPAVTQVIKEGGVGIIAETINADTINFGITQADVEKALKQREQEVLERIAVTNPSDRVIRELLQKELDAIARKLRQLEQSYQDEVKTRIEVAKTLEEFKEKLPSSQADSALEKLNAGKKEAAKELFDDVIAQAEQIDELAGKAAFENGRMADNDIRYLDAKHYYTKAVKFQPTNTNYINALGLIHYDLGDYDTAIEYYERALASDLKSLEEDHPEVALKRNNLGVAWYAKEHYKTARHYFEMSLAARIQKLGNSHPATKESMAWLESTQEKLKDPSDSK